MFQSFISEPGRVNAVAWVGQASMNLRMNEI